jgi:hypothetical protein
MSDRFYREFREPFQTTTLFNLFAIAKNKKDYDWQSYYNFNAVEVPPIAMQEEPLFQRLYKTHKMMVGIVEMDPYHFYEWHKDDDRNCSINFRINGNDSLCLFRETNPDSLKEVNSPVTELEYKFRTAYLFNTSEEHCVLNRKGTRHMMTVRFLGGETYEQMMEELEDEF